MALLDAVKLKRREEGKKHKGYKHLIAVAVVQFDYDSLD
jgi:hypothetical protein